MMERREALRLLGTAVTLQLIPGELYAVLRAARAEVDSGGALRTLNAKQNATVTRMANMILPETDTPGAGAARVNEFIDLIVTEWYNDEERARFLDGLANVDVDSQKSFGKNFVECTEAEQVKLLTEFDQAMAAEAATLKSHPRGARMEPPVPTRNFFHMFKQLTLTGYFTSEIGAKQALHFQMIPGHYDGCVSSAADRSK
jgi:Gluconate 2-dehydrogenase subunit 3